MKKLIEKLCERKYKENMSYHYIMVTGDYEEFEFEELEEGATHEFNYEDNFFYMLQIDRFGNKILFEFIKLGDELGYYKDWSFRKFVSTMKEVCESVDNVFVNNYDDSDDEIARAFYLAMVIDEEDFDKFYDAFVFVTKRCQDIIRITENRLNGIVWDNEYEKDEKLFCELYLSPFFKKIGFESVKYNHGNKEYGKDYVLVTRNIFREKEYYGVQVKAGDISGSAKGNAFEVSNQIKMAFKVPYEDYFDNKIYISKLIIVCSGNIKESATKIFSQDIERYMYTNIIFLDKKYFLSTSYDGVCTL